MILELPYSSYPVFSLKVYTPEATLDMDQISSMHTAVVPDDTYMVILDARDDGYRSKATWGYDRNQWLTFRPEYHNKERLGPKPAPVVEPKQYISKDDPGPLGPIGQPGSTSTHDTAPETLKSTTSERKKSVSRQEPPTE